MEDLKAGLLLLNKRKTASGELPHCISDAPHPPETGSLPEKSRGIYPDQVGGLYINIQYENHEMICVTGTSMKQFTLDRTLENEWDENVKKFLKKNGVVFS